MPLLFQWRIQARTAHEDPCIGCMRPSYWFPYPGFHPHGSALIRSRWVLQQTMTTIALWLTTPLPRHRIHLSPHRSVCLRGCNAWMARWTAEVPCDTAIFCPDVNCLIHWYKHLYPAWRINIFAESCQLFSQDGIKPYISYRIAFTGQMPASQNRWIAGNYKLMLLNVYFASGFMIIVGWQLYHGGEPCWILLLLVFL